MPSPSLWRPLLTPRCRLRDFREDDLPAFAAYRSDPAIARYQSWTPPYDLERARAFLESLRATPWNTPGTWYQIAIADAASDALLGDCAVHFLDDGMQVELGFTLSPAQHGRGLMREAVTALLDHLFGELAKHRAVAITDALNDGAVRLLTGLGFRREGHFLKNVFFKGAWGDEMLSPASPRSGTPAARRRGGSAAGL
jgi:RimJ/RimL family protein N-acetyltransferase